MTPIQKITISDIVNKIIDNTLLLPDIQQEYVWKKQAIELLFDSIFRGYPINTMMFWKIDKISRQPLDFYAFLPPQYKYGQSKNILLNKNAASDDPVQVVIDGQQRLTSIYIGLYGSYQTEKDKPMYLYLRLDAPSTDAEKMYDFRFLSDDGLKKCQSQGGIWFSMDNLTIPDYDVFKLLSANPSLVNNKFAMDTMKTLSQLLDGTDDYIHYYDINGYGSIEDVLEIFTRTNSSGTPLSKGDLLLSVLTTQWHNISTDENARNYVKGIIDEVKGIGYEIDRDWVIKCCLVLFSNNIKMQISNFSSTLVNGQTLSSTIYANKDSFRDSIIASFEIIKRLGLLEKGLTTKMAVIPIVQYVYEQKLWNTINKAHNGHIGHTSDKDIQKWLFRAIVQNLFEAGTDDILTKVKGIVSSKGTKTYFPYSELEATYTQLTITPVRIQELLSTQKVSTFPILNIIFKDRLQPGIRYEVDHTYPEAIFKKLGRNIKWSSIDDEALAWDGETYNSVLNLQLLTESENRSKNKMDLASWVAAAPNKSQLMSDHCIPNVSLDIADFKTYIDARSKLLETLLTNNL